MKRYILVAILALMTLVGCKVGEGTERDPNGSKKMLWHRVYSSVYSAYYYGNFAVYSDIVLSNNKEALEVMKESFLLSDNYSVKVFEDKVVLRENISTYTYTEYTIETKGKRLEEGGVWVLYSERYTTKGSTKKLVGTFIGKEGEKGAFSYKHTQSDAVVNCDMSYLYSSNNSIDVTVSCAGKEDGKGYVIDFVTNLQAPLIFKNGKLSEGEIDITYKDSSNSVIHAFTTEVVGAASSPYRIDDIVIYK